MAEELFESERNDEQKEEDKERLYSRDEIRSMIRRRILRSHQAFYERYGVNSLQELDELFNKIKVFEKEKERQSKIIEMENKIQNQFIIHQKQIDYALSLIGNLQKGNTNFKREKGSLFVFKGNEGVGKEYYSTIIQQILALNNVIEDTFYYIDASELSYVDIEEFFNKERDCFLVVDRFDLLLEDNNVFEKDERIALLKKFMLNMNIYMNDSYICLLGKEKPLDEFLNKYRLYKDYLACNLSFDEYDLNELTKILVYNLKENDYDVDGISFDILKDYIEKIKQLKSFKEAYSVVEYGKKVIEHQNKRTIESKYDKHILLEDLTNAFKEMIDNEKD